MRVLPLSVEDLQDMYEVLTAIELAAIERLAGQRLSRRTFAPLRKPSMRWMSP
jgi:DNA-binding GntR family transcriptional regulator